MQQYVQHAPSARASAACRAAAPGRHVPFASARSCSSAQAVPRQQQQQQQPEQLDQQAHSAGAQAAAASRRSVLLSVLSAPAVAMAVASAAAPPSARAAVAFAAPPEGYRLQVDKLDGYSFVYPENWLVVTSSGNDVFLRNPRNVEENLFVEITSPSSSRFKEVEDLGSPKEAAQRILDQYLTKEFMSTRIGISRYGEIVSASARSAEDGKTYYDVAIRMTSYGSRSPYVASRTDVLKDYGLEWDRTLSTTLGVSNQRLYELRLQSPTGSYIKSKDKLAVIMESFRAREVEKS